MSKKLVIVESPAKAKTIKKFLGKDYEVKASMGHISDLPKSKFGIDLKNKYKPTYEVSDDKKKVVKELKSFLKKSDEVYLATDEDREGEAIAWHIINTLKLPKSTPRIVFHEITETAINKAISNPRKLDMNLVDAQQGRRILDRIVGFKTSPILWAKVKRGLSAGRVQSVAVKLVVERENEIKNFIPKESWKIKSLLKSGNINFTVTLEKFKGKSLVINDEKELKKIIKDLKLSIDKFTDSKDKNDWKVLSLKTKREFSLINITTKETKKSPSAPFITSTLQQEASRRFGRSVKQVMSTAQKLYENGHITYMRTDSVNLSDLALNESKKYIEKNYGKEYHKFRKYKSKSANAQEAHEAIRPTYISKTPETSGLSSYELKLYTLIWNRTVASQMSDAIMENTTYDFIIDDIKDYLWLCKGQVVLFDGFLKLYDIEIGNDEDNGEDNDNKKLPKLKVGNKINSENITLNQQFTRPPARYTEATLVKKLESEGIGRPSTYAPTISTIILRGYVVKDGRYLVPTEISFVVVDFLNKYFDNLMDYKFTAKLEQELDDIAVGKVKRTEMIDNFYQDYKILLKEAEKGEGPKLPVGKNCPECGSELLFKFSSGGKFIGCSGYPDCKYKEQSDEDKQKMEQLRNRFEGRPCPEGGTIVVKVGRFGPFLTSSEYPRIKRISSIPDELTEKLQEKYGGGECDKCKIGKMNVKKYRKSYFLACSNYPDCKNTKSLTKKDIEKI